MTGLKTFLRAAGLGLCVVAFSGTALADPGNGNGGPPATPPGQEKKAEAPAPTAAPAPAPAPQAAAPGQAKKAENQAKQAAKATPPGQAKKAEKAPSKPAKAATPSKGQSANAHRHVIVCHRTGSLSNPYVVINIPYTAWTNGHATHPAKNGNADKLLKDPASRPGSKDGFDKSACGAAATPATTQVTPKTESKIETSACPAATTTTEQVLVGVWHATGAYKNGERKFVYITPSLGSAHYDRAKHPDDKPVYETRTVTRAAAGENCATVTSTSSTNNTTSTSNTNNTLSSTSNTQSSNQASTSITSNGQSKTAGAQAPVGGVAGAVSPAGAGKAAGADKAGKQAEKPAGGVLGAIASAPASIAETATTGTLPFTGLPLWIAALLGGVLLAGGFALRRTA